MTPLGLESGWAILGGLIPIIGFGLLAWILWRAVKPPDDGDGGGNSGDGDGGT